MDDTIYSEKLQIERKIFFFDMKENDRGVLLRITEDVRGRRDTIIVPASGLREFRDAIANEIPNEISLDELSMGMSGDFEIAIEEGATIVRVGSALFDGIQIG